MSHADSTPLPQLLNCIRQHTSYGSMQTDLCTAALAAHAAQQLPPLLLDSLDAVHGLHSAHVTHCDLQNSTASFQPLV